MNTAIVTLIAACLGVSAYRMTYTKEQAVGVPMLVGVLAFGLLLLVNA